MGEGPDPAAARRRYAELAATYERRGRLITRMRIAAVRRLELEPGDHVLDIGCGTGASFPYLVSAVGSTGRVTGVDLSEEMTAVARARISEAGWDNVGIVVSEAAAAPLPAPADAALLFLVHDLVRSPAVLEHVIAACRPGARIVAFGPKTAPRWNWPLNVAVRQGTRRYVTTFEGFDRPWSHLERLLDGFTAQSLALGAVYLGCGRVPAGDSS
jgi:demethylmenaquinone methyltransferase/2-methoxy-6-polyprenyl-1,4-benzoquinol methylase